MRKPDPNLPPAGVKARQADDEAAELRSRLDALKTDLGDAVAEERAGSAEPGTRRAGRAGADGGAIGTGLRAGSEMLAGVIVGGGIGYLIDRQAGTKPLFLIIFLMLGMVAGLWNVYRLAQRSGAGPIDRK